MNVFELRKRLIQDYSSYVQGFFKIKDGRIKEKVNTALDEGLLWLESLIQLNPSFESGKTIEELVQEGMLHPECGKIFRRASVRRKRRSAGRGYIRRSSMRGSVDGANIGTIAR